MIETLIFGATVGSLAAGFIGARQFVRDRLRYVDAVQRRRVPWLAGGLAAIAAAPVVWILPVVGAGTAILFGASVGAGVASGVRHLRRTTYQLEA